MRTIILYTYTALLTLIFFGCTKDDSVVDSVAVDSFPAFQRVVLSTYAFDTDSISVGTSGKTPDDPIQINFSVNTWYQNSSKAQVQQASVSISREGGSLVLAPVSMIKRNQNSDEYYASINLNIKRGDVGDYRVEVSGKDSRNLDINSVFTKFNVVYGTNPPVLSDLQAPDTLQAPSQGFLVFTFKVHVTDPSGQKDINKVMFNTTLPSGKPSSGNPFFMYDDATNGDVTANDGIYSLTVKLPSNTEKGKYRFDFQASDFSNLASKVITHFIIVQ